MPEINWYPGHMAKFRRILIDQLKSVDAVIELCDARAPSATRNPDLDRLCRDKVRILVMNKADLADDQMTRRWIDHFSARGLTAVKFNANGSKTREILSHIERATKPMVDRMKARGVNKTVRLMVIGIPNVGKSTFINRLYGGSIVKAADRPGVTRSNQWVKLGPYLEVLDTPGMLPPRLDDQNSARLLAYLGSIRDQIMDTEELAGGLLQLLYLLNPAATSARFKLTDIESTAPDELIEAACRGRGWLLSGARYDIDRASALILDEFRAGKVGKITIQPTASVR